MKDDRNVVPGVPKSFQRTGAGAFVERLKRHWTVVCQGDANLRGTLRFKPLGQQLQQLASNSTPPEFNRHIKVLNLARAAVARSQMSGDVADDFAVYQGDIRYS